MLHLVVADSMRVCAWFAVNWRPRNREGNSSCAFHFRRSSLKVESSIYAYSSNNRRILSFVSLCNWSARLRASVPQPVAELSIQFEFLAAHADHACERFNTHTRMDL